MYIPGRFTKGTPAKVTTRAGSSRVVVLPSPSWPAKLLPQQVTPPPARTTQEWSAPAPTAVAPETAATSTGRAGVAVVASPSCPLPFHPQHFTAPAVVVAQVWCRYEASATTPEASPGTETGAPATSPVGPDPNWPWEPPPQHFAAPEVVRTQLCSSPPTISAAPPSSPITARGTFALVRGCPIWPKTLFPQQTALVSSRTAQVWLRPAPSDATPDLRPRASTGARRSMLLPSPSWPSRFCPQQSTAPWVVSAQVCAAPAAIAFTGEARPGTSMGVRLWVSVSSVRPSCP